MSIFISIHQLNSQHQELLLFLSHIFFLKQQFASNKKLESLDIQKLNTPEVNLKKD